MITQFNIKVLLITIMILCGIMYTNNRVDFNEVVPFIPVKLAKQEAMQIECMAKNIFYEAGGESIEGQAAVARVVLNRVSHGFAKTPCGVIYQATVTETGKVCQFSWVCEHKGDPNPNSYRYKVARQIAYDVMINDRYDDVVPDSALFFHNMTVSPLWPYESAIRIGNHIFYSLKRKSRHD